MKTESWTTVDKTNWGPGPWNGEPDKAQWADKETGLPCLIVRGPVGALCGYVGVPEGHPWHGVDYSELPDDVEAHGGLTYSGHCQEDGDPASTICHIPDPGEPDNVWWLGFDCAHAGDHTPAMDHRVVYGTYWDLRSVTGECERLARQVVDAAGPARWQRLVLSELLDIPTDDDGLDVTDAGMWERAYGAACRDTASLRKALADRDQARADRDRKHDELHTETAAYAHRYTTMDARIAEARREERERCAESIFADEQKCQAAITADPTDTWMQGRLVGLQRARDIAVRARPYTEAPTRALPDAAPVCGADVDGEPWTDAEETPATSLADRLIGADPDYIGGEDVDAYIARIRNRNDTTTEENQ